MSLSQSIRDFGDRVARAPDLYQQIEATVSSFFRINDTAIRNHFHRSSKGTSYLQIVQVVPYPKGGYVQLDVRVSDTLHSVKLPFELGMSAERVGLRLWRSVGR